MSKSKSKNIKEVNMENFNNKESIRKEGIRVFKEYCRDIGIKADKETYLEYKKEAKAHGFKNMVDYIDYLKSGKENTEQNEIIKQEKPKIIDPYNLKHRKKVLIWMFIINVIISVIGSIIFIATLPSLVGIIICGIIILICFIIGIVWWIKLIKYIIDRGAVRTAMILKENKGGSNE